MPGPLEQRVPNRRKHLCAHGAAVEREVMLSSDPHAGAAMREWSPAAQIGMLKWLSDVVHEQPNPTPEIELWRVRKAERELRCVVVYLPSGIDVRLFEGADFRRTQLVRDAIESTAVSDGWKRKLMEREWFAH